MAIFFFCLCGQNLRTGEDQAGGYTRCPACGRFAPVPALHRANQAVGIDTPVIFETAPPAPVVPPVPSLELKAVEMPSQPFLPLSSRRASPLPPEEEDDDAPLRLADLPDGDDPREVQRKIERKKLRQILADAKKEHLDQERRGIIWPLERHWYECLLYPIRALGLLVGLALAWATLIALLLASLPELWEPVEIVARFPLLLVLFLLVGYTCACLQATLAAAAAGERGHVAWAERNLIKTALGGAQGVWCFLAGPIIPAAVAFYFWRDSGDLEVIDWCILLELGIVTSAWWALTLLAVQERGRFLDANPVAVVKLVSSVGYRAPLAALLGSVVVVCHGLVSLSAVEELHHGFGGWLLLVGSWSGQFFWVVFLLRWLGISRFQANKKVT